MEHEIADAAQDATAATGLVHRIRRGASPDAPLLLLVHGRAGTREVMWVFRRCIPEDAWIIAPQAPHPDPLGGYSWWKVEDKGLEGVAEAEAALGLLRGFIENAVLHYGLRPSASIAYGFSQGAGLLSLMLQRGAHRFGALALLAGFVLRVPDPVLESRPRILMAHGTKDERVPLDLARAGARHLEQLGLEVGFVEDPVGHKIGPRGIKELRAFTARELGRVD